MGTTTYTEVVQEARALANARVRVGKACGEGYIAGDLKCHAGDRLNAALDRQPERTARPGERRYKIQGGRLRTVVEEPKKETSVGWQPARRFNVGRPDTNPPAQAPRPAIQRPAPMRAAAAAARVAGEQRLARANELAARAREADENRRADLARRQVHAAAEAERIRAAAVPSPAAMERAAQANPVAMEARAAMVAGNQAREAIIAEHNARAAEANAQAVRDAAIVADIERQAAQVAAQRAAQVPQSDTHLSSIVRENAPAVVPPVPPAPFLSPNARAPIGRAAIAGINQAARRNDLAAVRAVRVEGANGAIRRWKQDVIAHMERQGRPAAPAAQQAAQPAVAPRAPAPVIAPITPERVNTHPEQNAIASRIKTAEETKSVQVGGRAQQNYGSAYRLELKHKDAAGNQVVTKVLFKPESGERLGGRAARRNIDDSPGGVTGARREVAAFDMAKELGISMPAVARVKHGQDEGAAMEWVVQHDRIHEGDRQHLPVGWRDVWNKDKTRMAELAMFDFIIGNTDRHGKNVIADQAGNIHPIDHGLSFPEKTGRETYGSGLVGGNASHFMRVASSMGSTPQSRERVDAIINKITSPEFSTWGDDFGKKHGLNGESITRMNGRIAAAKSKRANYPSAGDDFMAALYRDAYNG